MTTVTEPKSQPTARSVGPSRFSSKNMSLPVRVFWRVVVGAAILAILQLWITVAAPAYVATPWGIIRAIPSTISSAAWWSTSWLTVSAVLEGMVLAAVGGVVLGLAMGRVKYVRWLLTPYVNLLYTLPMVAVVPLLTLWLGFSNETRLTIIGISAFLPIVVSVADGSRRVSNEYLDVARSLRLPAWQVWFGIALRSALPFLLAGLELAVARAVIGAVAAEFLTGVNGLGYQILYQSRSFQENMAGVSVIALTLLVMLMRLAINLGRNRLKWYVHA